MAANLTMRQAEDLAAELDVGFDGVCLLCLSFVSSAVDGGDARDVAAELRRMTPDLWLDGLDERVLAAARRARDRGVPHAGAAVEDLEGRGGRSVVARAVVLRLARELSRRVRTRTVVLDSARRSLARTRPELN